MVSFSSVEIFWISLIIYMVFLVLSLSDKNKLLGVGAGLIGIFISLNLMGSTTQYFSLIGVIILFFNISYIIYKILP